jgi:hypothetical protein
VRLAEVEYVMEEVIFGFRVLGTLSNMVVSMFAWMAQFDDVSFLAVTSTE